MKEPQVIHRNPRFIPKRSRRDTAIEVVSWIVAIAGMAYLLYLTGANFG